MWKVPGAKTPDGMKPGSCHKSVDLPHRNINVLLHIFRQPWPSRCLGGAAPGTAQREAMANDLRYDSWASNLTAQREAMANDLCSVYRAAGLFCGHHLSCCYALFFYKVPKATLDTLAAAVWHRFRPLLRAEIDGVVCPA